MEFRELTLSDPVSVVDCGVATRTGSVYCARDGTIIERTPSGDTLRTLAACKQDAVTCMTLVAGKELRLWAGMASGFVRVYAVDKVAGEVGPVGANAPALCRAECLGHSGAITCIISHGRRVYTGSADKCVFEWHADTMEIVRALPSQRGMVRATAGIGMALFTADSTDFAIRCWNLGTCKPAGKLMGHSSTVRSIMYHMQNGTLWTGGEDGNILVWDVSEQEIIATLLTHTQGVIALTQSSTGFVFSAGEDGLLCIYTSTTPARPQCVKVVNIPNIVDVMAVKEEASRVELWVVRRRLGIRAVEVVGRSAVGGMPEGAQQKKKAARGRSAQKSGVMAPPGRKPSIPKATKRSATPTQASQVGGRRRPSPSPAGSRSAVRRPSPSPAGRAPVRRASPSPAARGATSGVRKASPSPMARKASPSPMARKASPSPHAMSRSDSYTGSVAGGTATAPPRKEKRSAETLALIEENKMLRRQLLQAQGELASEQKQHEGQLRINRDREAHVQAALFQTTNSIADMISLVKRNATQHPQLKLEWRDLLQAALGAHKTLMDFKQPARASRLSRSPLRQRGRSYRSPSPGQQKHLSSPHRRKSPRGTRDGDTASLQSCDDRMPLKRGAWYTTRDGDAAAVATGEYSSSGRVGLPVAVGSVETDEVVVQPAHARPAETSYGIAPRGRGAVAPQHAAAAEAPACDAHDADHAAHGAYNSHPRGGCEAASVEEATAPHTTTLDEDATEDIVHRYIGLSHNSAHADPDADAAPASDADSNAEDDDVFRPQPMPPTTATSRLDRPTPVDGTSRSSSPRPSRLAAMLDEIGVDNEAGDDTSPEADGADTGVGVYDEASTAGTDPNLELSMCDPGVGGAF